MANDERLKIGIILGSTRPNRASEAVGKWVYDIARQRTDAEFELVDLRELHLPIMDEGIPPAAHRYSHDHTKTWAAKIASFDGFVFVTPEYHHGIPGALKNAIDFLYHEWVNKAAGFVSYGSAGGVRAVEQLRLVMAELQVATVRSQVQLGLFTDFESYTKFTPGPTKAESVTAMLDSLVAWSRALRTLRVPEASARPVSVAASPKRV